MWRYCVLLLLFVVNGAASSANDPFRIYICPGDVTLNYKVQHQFQVFGLDVYGNEVPITGPVTWTADPAAGTITSTGLFTAGTTNGIYNSGVTASTSSLSASVVVVIGSPPADGGFIFEKSWGGYGPGHLNYPRGIAVAANGDIYVADTYNNRIQVFDTNGNYKKHWGQYGTGNGQFIEPMGMAIDSNGYLYVTDSGNARIQKFDLNGNFISKFGSRGQANGEMFWPEDVAVDGSGNIYVADTYNDRIQKFSSSGQYITKWGGFGVAEGKFDTPRSLAVNSSGQVYVADRTNNRVQVFSSNGTFISAWGNNEQSSVQFDYPGAIEVDANNNVYVADYSLRVQKLNSQGEYITQYSPLGRPLGRMLMTTAVAVSSTGYIYLADSNNNSIKKLNSAGNQITYFGSCYDQKGQLNHADGVATDRWGNIYIPDYSGQVQVFDPSGMFIRRWAFWGSANNQLIAPRDIVIGPDDKVYIADGENCCVKKFDLMGNFIQKWGSYGYGSGQFIYPWSLDIDAQGNVYVADHTRCDIQKFNSGGQFLGVWYPDNEDRFIRGICTAPDGTNYAADAGSRTICKFSKDGNLIGNIGTPGYEQHQLNSPWCVELDARGNLYIGDSSQIKVFDPAGNFIKCFGKYGTGVGEFDFPDNMQFDIFGNLYVADPRCSRVNKFVPVDGSLGMTKHRRNGELVSLTGQVVTAGSSELGDCFYIQSEDRSCGIKVTGKTATRGSKVTVKGILTTVNGEREIQASSVTMVGSGTIAPITLGNKALGGGDSLLNDQPGTGQQGIAGAAGLNNIGLLVRTLGRVTYAGSGFFYIDDGSHLDDGSGYAGVKVQASGFAIPSAGAYVQVTGISSCYSTQAGLQRLIRTRTGADISVLDGTMISGKITQSGTTVIPTLVESEHPYSNNFNYTWTITGPPSATRMRVHFSSMQMEYNHDYLYLLNGAGVQQARYNTVTTFPNYWSQWVDGNTIKLKLTSDASGTRYGFQVDSYEVEAASAPVAGVTLTLMPSGITTVTDTNGEFSFIVSQAGNYTVTPSLAGATFTPQSRSIAVTAGQAVTGVDFSKN